MDVLSPYLPIDRREAMARGADLPDRTTGAALFADVSGFTPLTEALAKDLGPKRGAEELTRQLNSIFDALIAEVDRYRGSVIIFGGDALTCWFDGDAGQRAVACGLAMQEAMQQFAAITTPSGGTVSLSMKAAIATGPVRRFRVGDPHIQIVDVLAGTTLDAMSEAEHHAQKGEVVLSPQAAAQLGAAVQVVDWRDSEEGRFAVVSALQTPVTPESWPALSALSEAQLSPWVIPPVFERLTAGQAQLLAEIRPTVSLFMKFGGIDYDADDEAGPKFDAYLRWVQAALYKYEGYMLQVLMGDKGSHLYATFGAPLAHDDDSARAVAAALELSAPPPELNFIRGTQIGISAGRLWAGAYGATTRRTYGVLGDAVNLSARLMAKASAGQILVSQSVVDAAGQNYEFESIGRVQVKGKQEPIPVSRVLERRAPSARKSLSRNLYRLVGRDAELAQMENILQITLKDEGQILRLEGGMGLGKSYLASEFAARAEARGARVVVGTCQSTTENIPYTPWQQIFRLLFELPEADSVEAQVKHVEARLREANPNWLIRLPVLRELLGVDLPDNATTSAFNARQRQDALFALAVELVQRWAQAQPLVLMIEDAQWMDENSLGLALALGRVIARMHVLLILVQRPPVREDKPLLPDLNRLSNHHHLTLTELSPENIAALVDDRLTGRPTPLALALIQRQAQGNPLFTEALVSAMREAGTLYRSEKGDWYLSDVIFNALREANCLVKDNASGEWLFAPNAQLSAVDLGIPDSVHGIVLSRIDRLPEAHKVTLKVASVIGQIFEFNLLEHSHPAHLDAGHLTGQMNTLEARDFTWQESPPPRPVHAFKHNITYQVAYDTLLESQQRELHLVVGETLEEVQPEAVERLAYHFSRSGQRDKTLFYLDKAARKTQREYANETALNYYTQALALAERWEWREGQVNVLHVLGRREAEQEALRALEAIPSAPPFQVAYLWGHYYEAIGDYAQAQQAVERALAAARATGDILDEAQALSQLGLIARRQGDYETAQGWYQQAFEIFHLKEKLTDEEAVAFVQTLNGFANVFRQRSEFDKAEACYYRALTILGEHTDRQGEAEVFNGLGSVAYYQRNFADAIRYHQQALETRRAIGQRAGEGISLYNLALAMQELGDYSQTESYYTAALAIQQAVGNRWEEGNICNGLGVLYQSVGDLPQAENILRQGLQVTEEIGDQAGQAYILANLGLVVRDQGDLAGAGQMLNEGLRLAQEQADKYLMSYFQSYLAGVSLARGQADDAIQRANASYAMRMEADMRLFTADDLATLAAAHRAAGQMDQALDYARQSRALLDECAGQGPETPQRDYFVCHQVFAAGGEAGSAQHCLREARRLVMERAEKIKDPALRQSFLGRVPINREIVQAASRPD